jgi:hypothetical protein
MGSEFLAVYSSQSTYHNWDLVNYLINLLGRELYF